MIDETTGGLVYELKKAGELGEGSAFTVRLEVGAAAAAAQRAKPGGGLVPERGTAQPRIQHCRAPATYILACQPATHRTRTRTGGLQTADAS